MASQIKVKMDRHGRGYSVVENRKRGTEAEITNLWCNTKASRKKPVSYFKATENEERAVAKFFTDGHVKKTDKERGTIRTVDYEMEVTVENSGFAKVKMHGIAGLGVDARSVEYMVDLRELLSMVAEDFTDHVIACDKAERAGKELPKPYIYKEAVLQREEDRENNRKEWWDAERGAAS